MSNEKDCKKLRWVRIFTPIHIPKYLIEQIKDRSWKVEEYIKYHEINCLVNTESSPALNPFSHLYALVNQENITKGFLWFTIEPLTKDIHIQNYSIDKEYWGKGKAVELLANHIKVIKKKAHLHKVFWITSYPKHSQKCGFTQSKSILMEYSEENNGKNIHRGSKSHEEYRPVDPRAETVLGEHIRGGGTAGTASILAVSTTVQPSAE